MKELLRVHSIYADASATSGDHTAESAQSGLDKEETIPYNLHDQELTATGNEGKNQLFY